MASNLALWQSQGSVYLAQTNATAPVIFFYNTDDAAYYQDQIVQFKAKLDALSVPTSVITNYGTGHAVPQTSASLTTVYNFFNQYLTPPNVTTGIENQLQNSALSLTLSPNPATTDVILKFSVSTIAKLNITLYNLTGIELYKSEKQVDNTGMQTETIHLENLNLSQGIYYVKVQTNEMQGIQKLLKK